MDAAYDHITEETLRNEAVPPTAEDGQNEGGSLNTDLQEAYKTLTSSPWGAKFGGFLGSVRKQSETYIQSARNEAAIAGGEALKGFTDLKTTLVSRARSMSQGEETSSLTTAAESSSKGLVSSFSPSSASTAGTKDATTEAATSETSKTVSTDLSSGSFLSQLTSEGREILRDLQKAEDAADEALLKFGANISNFLRDAITVSAPSASASDASSSNTGPRLIFESRDTEGKRVIHTTRLDAQLHVIHCSLDSFIKDPASGEWGKWKEQFKVEEKTDDIAKDLEKYEELRRAMEKLVPEKVDHESFWARYYFLRMVVESEEKRRRELLKRIPEAAEEVGWDEDSDAEEPPRTPQASGTPTTSTSPDRLATPSASKTGVTAPASLDPDGSKPTESRKSQDQLSQSGGSEASYDLVSGATSRAPGSPREDKKDVERQEAVKEESDEEDWE